MMAHRVELIAGQRIFTSFIPVEGNLMIEKNATSVVEFIQLVLSIKESWYPDGRGPDLWFRGVKDARFELLPGAYFRPKCNEQSIVLFFRSQSPSLLPREPSDDWEWYYLMQHYGIPTRLLDWTENPLSALYFALEVEAPGSSPCVWVIDPLSLNRLSGINNILLPYPNTDLDYWLPDNCGRHRNVHTFEPDNLFPDNSKPLAIYPKRHNPRIVAQRGVFTVHGMDETPINKLPLTDEAEQDSRIAKIVFDPQVKAYLNQHLWILGIT
ncbi:MAG TPA: FRG domain-containing protein, partial [Pyrinomonadaceae bacterium]